MILPTPAPGLIGRSWLAVNSAASARIAGALGFNILFSHLRTPADYRTYRAAYREAGGAGLVAANRPVFVGIDDDHAHRVGGPALRALWHRFRLDGKIPADAPEPTAIADLASHPINFVIGGPASVAQQLADLHAEAPFDVLNAEIRWPGLAHADALAGLDRLMTAVVPRFDSMAAAVPVNAGVVAIP